MKNHTNINNNKEERVEVMALFGYEMTPCQPLSFKRRGDAGEDGLAGASAGAVRQEGHENEGAEGAGKGTCRQRHRARANAQDHDGHGSGRGAGGHAQNVGLSQGIAQQ